MARIHSFEFGDQQWFPSFLRDYETDFLRFLAVKAKLFSPAKPILEEMIHQQNCTQLIDIASGGGGSVTALFEEMRQENPELKLLLTDYFPNIPAFQQEIKDKKGVSYCEKSIDARKVPTELKGLRTQFLSFHHFKPNDAVLILQNAVDSNSPIAIFEGQERTFASILAMALSPISVLLTTPFIRPFRLGRILFTYFIPILPLIVCWDGIISSLRTYNEHEMQDLIQQVKGNERFEWQVGRLKSGAGAILFLTGIPKR